MGIMYVTKERNFFLHFPFFKLFIMTKTFFLDFIFCFPNFLFTPLAPLLFVSFRKIWKKMWVNLLSTKSVLFYDIHFTEKSENKMLTFFFLSLLIISKNFSDKKELYELWTMWIKVHYYASPLASFVKKFLLE